jgi:hypothetical protein
MRMLLVYIGRLQGGGDYNPREGTKRQNPVMPIGVVNRKCEKNSPFPYPSIDHHRRHDCEKWSPSFMGCTVWFRRMETVNRDCGKTALFRAIVNMKWQVRETSLLIKEKLFFEGSR